VTRHAPGVSTFAPSQSNRPPPSDFVSGETHLAVALLRRREHRLAPRRARVPRPPRALRGSGDERISREREGAHGPAVCGALFLRPSTEAMGAVACAARSLHTCSIVAARSLGSCCCAKSWRLVACVAPPRDAPRASERVDAEDAVATSRCCRKEAPTAQKPKGRQQWWTPHDRAQWSESTSAGCVMAGIAHVVVSLSSFSPILSWRGWRSPLRLSASTEPLPEF
jgi:hypothetical protein